MKSKAILLLAIVLTTTAVAAQTYVAVGDSLAFGFQEQKFYNEFLTFSYDPATFNTGFVDVVSQYVHNYFPNLVTVNFSCPGETTITAVSGGCPFHNSLFALPLHQSYPGSTPQMYAVMNYLKAHPGEVWFITLTLGANDMLNFLSNCNGDATCIQQGLPKLTAGTAAYVAGIIGVMKAASPHSVIVWTNVPDPYQFTQPATVPVFASFNQAVGTAAKNAGARVVDWFTTQQSLNQAQLCYLSFVCTPPLNDIHPTDAGYKVLGYQTLQVLLQ